MSNRVYITMNTEMELNTDFTPKGDCYRNYVYVNCDEVKAWIGEAYNRDDLMEIVDPNVFEETLTLTLSEGEYFLISAALKYSGGEYWLGDEKFTIQAERLEEKDYE